MHGEACHRVDKAFGLIHVDFFSQLSIEERGVNVHTMAFKVKCHGESKEKTQILHANDRREGLIEVNARAL